MKKGYVTRNFKKSELCCPCCKKCSMDDVFMTRVQALRDEFASPMTVNSGFRCPKENKEAGGAKTSQHLVGKALDISTKGFTPAKKYKLLRLAFSMGFKGVAQGKSFIHLDMRSGTTSTWTYK